MAKVYPVMVQAEGGDAAKHYSPEFQSAPEYASGWKAVLIKARQGGTVKCACPGTGKRQLSIRHFDTDTFFLARYPFTGWEHANDCRFYAPNPDRSGLCGYQKGVVEEGQNGVVRIRLDVGLKKQKASETNSNSALPSPSRGQGRNSQPAMRLLGLLHFLWDEADLNSWWPAMQGKRDHGLVNWELEKAASQIIAGKIRLDSVLLLADQNPKGRWACRNQERVRTAVASGTRMIAILPLAQYTPERMTEMETSLKVSGFNGVPLLDMPRGLWQRTRQRFPRTIAAWEKQQRVMAIVELDLKKDGKYAKVVDVALMPVSANWIPFDSLYELKVADKLTAEGRGFIKPLRFDADEDVVFPDFILRDTGDDTPLEVFGRSDEAYEARREAKTAYYTATFGIGNWWCWNAAADPEGLHIQPFPPTS